MSELEGFNELSKKLSELGEKVGSKYLRQSLMAAALPVVKAAKADIPKGSTAHKLAVGRKSRKFKTYKGRLVAPGFASRNIARKSFLSRNKRTAFVLIGVKKEAFYALNFLELGTKNMPKRPWLTKALERQQRAVIRRLGDRLRKKIEQVAKS